MRGENTGQRHRTLPRTRIRSRLRFGRHVRAVRRVRTQPSGQRQQHLRLWPGIEPDHMEDGQDEPLHPRHRRRPRPEERRHVLQRPTPHRTIRLHPGQPSVQHVGLGRRQAQGRSALGVRHAARRQRELRVDAAYDPPSLPIRPHRTGAGQRLAVVADEQRG